MMKILLINTVPTRTNGITNVIFNFIRASDSKKIQYDYVSINKMDSIYIDMVKLNGGKCFVFERSIKTLVSYILRLKRVIREMKYDAVHIHANSHMCIIELIAALMGGCKVRIVHAHSTSCGSRVVHECLKPLFDALCPYRLACGMAAGKFMFRNKTFVVLNNGIDTYKYSFSEKSRMSIRNKLGILNDEILMGHVGYFQAVKNQKYIVSILYQLVSKGKNFKLVLIGDGDLRAEVDAQVDQLKLNERVIFTGNINNVEEYLSAMDIIVMPSLFEGFPLSLMEQQVNGLQCVCSDTITTDVDKTGNVKFVSLKKTAGQWADVICSFFSNMGREQRSQEAVKSIEEAGYSIQAVTKKLERYYINVIYAGRYNIDSYEE